MIACTRENMQRLLALMFGGCGVKAFLDEAEDVLGMPMTFTVWESTEIVRSCHAPSVDIQTMPQETRDHRASYVLGRLEQLEEHKPLYTNGGPGIPGANILCWATHAKVRYGLIVINRTQKMDEVVDVQLLNLISDCVAQICAMQQMHGPTTEEELLGWLLSGRIETKEQLYDRHTPERLMDRLKNRLVVLFPMDEKKLAKSASFISMHIHQNYEDVFGAQSERAYAALFAPPRDGGEQRALQKRLAETGRAFGCCVCYGRVEEDLMHLKNAVDGMMTIPALKTAADGELVWAEYYPEAMLLHEARLSKPQLGGLYFPIVEEIRRYDEQNNTQYFKTVQTYVEKRMNASETAQQLFIHPNTVLYRLNKIQEIWNIDILDANVLYGFLFTFRMMTYA